MISFLSCAHKAAVNEEYIIIGNGGGLTGAVAKYKLTASGRLFYSSDMIDNFQLVGKMKKDLAFSFFENYHTLNLNSIELDIPGNRFFFIEYFSGQSHRKIMWTEDADAEIGPLILYYGVSMRRIRDFIAKN